MQSKAVSIKDTNQYRKYICICIYYKTKEVVIVYMCHK